MGYNIDDDDDDDDAEHDDHDADDDGDGDGNDDDDDDDLFRTKTYMLYAIGLRFSGIGLMQPICMLDLQ